MKNKNGLGILALTLSIVFVATIVYQANDTNLQNIEPPINPPIVDPQQSSVVPKDSTPEEFTVETLNPLGDLSKYDLIIDYEYQKRPRNPSIINILPVPLINETVIEVGVKVFQMPEAVTLKKTPWEGIQLKGENKKLLFFGINRIYYSENDIEPVVESWDEEKVLEVAEEFLKTLSAYWQYDTDVTYELKSIHPSWTTTRLNPETKTETVIVRAIGVFYSLYVNGIELTGPGADFSLWIADDRVINAEIHRPAISIGEEITIVKTHEEALEDFIQGKNDTAKIGYQKLYPVISDEGTCTITSVKLVYFIDFSGKQKTEGPLLYEIRGTLSYIDPLDDEPETFEFIEYQFATN